ncbi:MAG: hypothetical protein AAF409_17290 [Pseudomonadota bacterium]
MTRQDLTAPKVPTQAQIDAAVGKGRRLRSEAFVELFSAIGAAFTSKPARPTDHAYGNPTR